MGLTVQQGAYAEGLEQGRAEMRELLQDCLEAFKAIPTAGASRKMLKKIGEVPSAYAGNGSHILATKMAEIILRHLSGGSTEND